MTRRLETSAPEALSVRLADVRKRTLDLISVLDWNRLRRQHVPILSPMLWDLGHVGSFEETWVGGNLADEPPLEDGFQEMFDPVVNPRSVREDLPLGDPPRGGPGNRAQLGLPDPAPDLRRDPSRRRRLTEESIP